MPIRFRTPSSDIEAAPLLCAGIIGFRALRRTDLPPGGRLGIYGFGGSAHLTAQIALAEGARLHVMTRSPAAQRLALELGAAAQVTRRTCHRNHWMRRSCSRRWARLCHEPMEALDRGGTLAIAGIYLSDIPSLNYDRHLFEERTLRSVTANTRADGTTFLEIGRPDRGQGLDHGLFIRRCQRRTGGSGPGSGQWRCRPRSPGPAIAFYRRVVRRVTSGAPSIRFPREQRECGDGYVLSHLHRTVRTMRRRHDGNGTNGEVAGCRRGNRRF